MRTPSVVFAVLLLSCCGGPGTSPAPKGSGDNASDTGAGSRTPEPEEQVSVAGQRAQMVRDLAALDFHKLGNSVLRWDHIPKVTATKKRPHKLLVVLVEFADRGFDRFRGDPKQGTKLAQHYQTALFDESYSRWNTLSHYYANQSQGRYHLTGEVLTPIKLSKGREAYGMPTRPAGGSWRNDGDPQGMVEEALGLAAKSFPKLAWEDFDRWDPEDHDGDGNLNEADGYLDHFVLVFAGGGQSSCQLLNKLGAVFTPNAAPSVIEKLDTRQRECAARLWPHRFRVQKREGQGPKIGGTVNRLGGVPLTENLWAFDYNMQSEYVGAPTLIHEFGHSLGLPDVYSRGSSNSTGAWEVMSGTAGVSPQSLSSWSRLMLGWLKPKVILPPEFGGAQSTAVHLRTLDAAVAANATGTEGAALVVLPPKTRVIELTGLPAASGSRALYSGQGNDMNRSAELRVDLASTTAAKSAKLELSFDAWWEIEAGWDFAYVEVSIDEGKSWTRQLPVDRRHMPAKHGHDGKGTVPGLTGISGDLDGDGKNESHPDCDPKQKIAHGEDKASAKKSACLAPSFVRIAFDLSHLRGKKLRARLRYFTDGAAVKRGLLIDNVAITGVSVRGDFESAIDGSWQLEGWSRSTGRHEVLVPHFYLLEYRDPYGDAGRRITPETKPERYDQTLSREYYSFYYDTVGKQMMAAVVRSRPGVVAWYYNGSWAWSENDPGSNGAGEGYLLALDSNPNEIAFPGWEPWLQGKDDATNTHYDTSSAEAQAALRKAYFETVCFVRNRSYLPKGGIPKADRPRRCGKGRAPLGRLKAEGRPMLYSYQRINQFLPGAARLRYQSAGELVDVRVRKGKQIFRPRMRTLRSMHTKDAPFSLEPFPRGITFYKVKKGKLVETSSQSYPARPSFDDGSARTWQNPKLPFGGVKVPELGFSFELVEPGKDAPAGTEAKVKLSWKKK